MTGELFHALGTTGEEKVGSSILLEEGVAYQKGYWEYGEIR